MLGDWQKIHPRFRIDTHAASLPIFEASYHRLMVRTDHIFAALYVFQWVLAILLAMFLSPLSYSGSESFVHMHVYAAFIWGGVLASFPVYRNLWHPGATANRFLAAVTQMGFSILIIHITGGRIESHFHIFGSLAFLAFYRDWRVLGLATVLTAADHLFRGTVDPLSVYGVYTATPWRAVEHSAWVVFEDIFLMMSIRSGLMEMVTVSRTQYDLQRTLATVEFTVEERTRDLVESQKTVLAQEYALQANAKMSALGEMAGGVAHEVNNPIAVIKNLSSQISEILDEGGGDTRTLRRMSREIERNTDRVGQIITGLKSFAEISTNSELGDVEALWLMEQVRSSFWLKIETGGIHFEVFDQTNQRPVLGRATELEQAIEKLVLNSIEAVDGNEKKFITLTAEIAGPMLRISVEDNGRGIALEHRDRIFNPFFTTKDFGQGVGLGLSIALGIVKSHGGNLYLDPESRNTRMVVELPLSLAVGVAA